MPIATLPSDAEAIAAGFAGAECRRRRHVLRETLDAFEVPGRAARLHALAQQNLRRWAAAAPSPTGPVVAVRAGDWGAVTLEATRRAGACFAVLNMANAYAPGGAYGEGAVAQEENMFRRTDCHFRVAAEEIAEDGRSYRRAMTRLISAEEGRVYLDTAQPRVCIRGPEDRARTDLGYEWLADDEVFPFFELRAAARDLRDGSPFDAVDARRRIGAVLDTLRAAGIRHAVLGALGCGAFQNPAERVAPLFREELEARRDAFDVVVFAIYSAGYGPDNFTPFARVFDARS